MRAKLRDIVSIYWELVRIVAPVTIIAQILMETGVIAAISPIFRPLMAFYGLPAELAFALLAGMLVGVWNAAILLFVLVPVGDLTVADVTVFSTLILFAHALPIEQQIIRRTGVSLILTSALRIGGGLVYAALLHGLLSATGWLSQPVDPVWTPAVQSVGWIAFLTGLAQGLAMMFVILTALILLMDLLRITGLMGLLNRALAPVLGLAGIRGEALQMTAVGLFLGVSYGGGLLIREARAGHIPPRQVLLSCIFMGFAHSVIEDTLIFAALGADLWAILAGRIVFAIAATALIAAVLARLPQRRAGVDMSR